MENSQLIKKQNGGYSKVYPLAFIQGIIDAETNEKLTDILIRYNHIYVPWKGSPEDTRDSVPLLMRRHGLWISYDKDGSLYTEWFKNSSTDALLDLKWKDSDNWEMIPNLSYINSLSQQIPNGAILPEMLSPALQEFLSEHHTIINLPDDEDLEQHCNIIRLKDRDYNEVTASGYGTKILRKNWQGRHNALVQDMMLKPHTIYEVRYDFNLLGNTITLPENSVLYFTGGSLSNGTIVGNNSSIIAPENQLIFSDIVIDGSWVLSKVFSKWFNLSQVENFDNITNFRNMMKLATSDVMTEIYIEKGDFYTSNYSTKDGVYYDVKGISIPSNVYIHNAATIRAIPNDYEKTAVFYLGDVENITIDGGKIIGDVREHTGTTGEWGIGIYPVGARNVVIKNIEISECWGDGIDIQALYSDYENGTTTGHCKNILIDNVKCLNNRRQGLSVEGVIGLTVRNSEFSGTGSIKYTAPGAGIDIEPWFDTEVVGDIVIENCRLFNNYASGLLLIPRDNELSENFTFKDIVSDEGIWIRGGRKITVTNWQATGIKGYCCIWGKASDIYIANSKFTNELYCDGNLNNVQIDRCTFNMATPSWSGFAVSFHAGDSNAYQNISISNCIFTDTGKIRWISIGTATSKIDFINNFIQCASKYELQLGGGDFIGNTVLQMDNSRTRILNKTGNTVKIINNVFISDQYTESMLEFADTASIVNGSTITKDYIINNNDFSKGSYWTPFGGNYNLLSIDLKYNKFNKDVRQFIPSTWSYIDGKEDEWYVSTYSPSSRNNIGTSDCYCITVPNARSKVKISTSNKYTVQASLYNTETEFEINPDASDIIRRPTTVGSRAISLDNTDMAILPQFATEITEDNKVNIYMTSGLSGAINLVPIIELRTQSETGPTAIKVSSVTKPTNLQFTLKVAGNMRSYTTSIQSYIEKYSGMEALLGSNSNNKAVYNGTEWINTDGTKYNKVVIV